MAKLPSWAGFAAIALLAAWPLRDGLLLGEVVGAGPDVASTLWGMWWFQQTLLLFGGASELSNFPYGSDGMVLTPSSALLWALAEPLVGVGRAAALSAWLQVAGLALGCMFLARQAGCSAGAVFAAGLSPLAARHMFFGIGEGSLVAVAALPLPLGLAALVSAARAEGGWLAAACAGACMAWCAIENPYLAPVLPGLCLLLALFRGEEGGRGRLLAASAIGAAGVLFVASAFGRVANPDYPTEVAGQLLTLGGRQWSVVDLPWARLGPLEPFVPSELSWTLDDTTATAAGGGNYLGISVLALAFYGAARSSVARWWLLFGIAGAALAFGSVQGGFAGPFLALNAVMEAIARPLTQPTRYVALTLVGVSVAAGLGFHASRSRAWVPACLAAALLADAFMLGGLSLKPPNTSMPSLACSRSYEGPVLVWPWDARDMDMSRSLLFQIAHGQPAAHTGIASWGLRGGKRFIDELRGAGFREGSARLNQRKLYDSGFRWVIAEDGYDSDLLRRYLRPVEDCGGAAVYALSPSAPSGQVPGGR